MARQYGEKKTKLRITLEKYGMTQTDLYNKIIEQDKEGRPIGHDRISRLCSGQRPMTRLTVATVKAIKEAIGCSYDEILD